MGPDYNKIILVYKYDTPFLAQYGATLRKIALERGILFILTLPVETSHCRANKLYLKYINSFFLQHSKHNKGTLLSNGL